MVDSVRDFEEIGAQNKMPRHHRRLIIFEAQVDATDSLLMELRDLSPEGLGLSSLKGSCNLLDGETVSITVQSSKSSLARLDLAGKVVGSVIVPALRINGRSLGIALDAPSRRIVCDLLRMLPMPPDERPPAHATVGYRRAWNTINSDDRRHLIAFFADLQGRSVIGPRIILNLNSDENSSAFRILEFLKDLIVEGRKNPKAPILDKLNKATSSYIGRVRLSERIDKRIPERHLGRRVVRFVRREIIENWVAAVGKGLLPRDIVDGILGGRAGSLDLFREALRRRPTPQLLGAPNSLWVWCMPAQSIDDRLASGADRRSCLRSVGVPWWQAPSIEMRYETRRVSDFYKPCALHAPNDYRFRRTAESEPLGLTEPRSVVQRGNNLFRPAKQRFSFGVIEAGCLDASHKHGQ